MASSGCTLTRTFFEIICREGEREEREEGGRRAREERVEMTEIRQTNSHAFIAQHDGSRRNDEHEAKMHPSGGNM
jgi:hypothetical protein